MGATTTMSCGGGGRRMLEHLSSRLISSRRRRCHRHKHHPVSNNASPLKMATLAPITVLWEEEIPIDNAPTGATVTLLDAEGTGAGKGNAEYQPTCKVRIAVQIFATGSTVYGRAGNAHSSHVMVLSAICTFDGRGANSIGGSPLRYLNSASTCANDALLHMNEIDPKGPFK
jgi:hypothetical protein